MNAEPTADDRAFLERVGQTRSQLPDPVLNRLRPLLADRTIPITIRVQAAARALASLPDTPEALRKIVRPLASGLSPLRRLERLRQLQHQIETHRSLDALIARREARLKMDCPRCGLRYPREVMVRHLWHEHGLLMEHGKIRSPRRTVRELQAEHADSRDTTVLDRTSLLAADADIRAWAAASTPPDEDIAALTAEAKDQGCGLCPGCFAERLPSLDPLPPPLSLGHGRLAGDGSVVQIGGGDWLRTLSVTTPTHLFHFAPDARLVGARGLATLVAASFLLAAFVVLVFGSREWSTPPVLARFVLAAVAAYILIRLMWRPTVKLDERAVDAAWSQLVPKLLDENTPSRWLARLCRTSLERGDPEARAEILNEIVDSTSDRRLLAAASVLRAFDRSRLGHDRAAAITDLVAAGFRSGRSTAFSEHAAECYLSADPPPSAPERARIRVLLLAEAFEAGLTPRDLSELWAAAPHLRRLMDVEPLHRLALLEGVWRLQAGRGWERIARAESVFELCRTAPNISGRLVVDFPDLLLIHRPDPDTEAQLGPVLICTRGIVVGGRMIADPQSEVKLERAAGRIELIFGPHRFTLERVPLGDFAGVIREWLRFRAWALLPLLDNYLVPTSAAVSARVLAPFRSKCPNCGTVAAIIVT
jgi:hypothetical protein